MSKYNVKKFYHPQVVFIQEAEGDPMDILKVIVSEDKSNFYAVSFEPKGARAPMRALDRYPMYYFDGQVFSLEDAKKVPECADVVPRLNAEQHVAVVKCKNGAYIPLCHGDIVFDPELKRIWPKGQIKTPVSALTAVLKNSGRNK